MEDQHTRRTFLTATGATALGIALAGCAASQSSTGGGGTPTDRVESPASDEGGSGGDGSSGEWTEVSTVEMTDELTFSPEKVQVSAGTTVTWENVGAIGHTVTAYEDEIPNGASYFASGGFDSQEAANDGYPEEGNITEGGTYEHTFETTGTYEYYCIPHEMNGMVGTVKVV